MIKDVGNGKFMLIVPLRGTTDELLGDFDAIEDCARLAAGVYRPQQREHVRPVQKGEE
jgi:hypothetical protein